MTQRNLKLIDYALIIAALVTLFLLLALIADWTR